MPPKSTSDSAASNRKSSREIKPAGPPKPSSAQSVSRGTKLTHAVLGEDVGAVKMNEIQERDIEVMNEKEFMDLVGFKLERDVDEDEDDEGENGEGSSSPKK